MLVNVSQVIAEMGGGGERSNKAVSERDEWKENNFWRISAVMW